MRLGEKPLADMSPEELLESITTLREEREALRAEAIKRKQESAKGNIVKESKKVKVKEPTEMDKMLAFLAGEKELPT